MLSKIKSCFKNDASDGRQTCLYNLFAFASFVFYFLLIFVIFEVYILSLPPKNFPKTPYIYEIKSGESVSELAENLQKNGLIKSSLLFKIWFSLKYDSAKAGDYLFKKPENVWKIASRLASGAHGLEPVKILIKEGATRREIAEILHKKLLRFNKDKFLLLSKDMEGFLFPDTYYFLPNASEELVIKTMFDNFKKQIEPLKEDMEKSELSLKDIVTLASIVEREAFKYEDRRKIAGVLLKRLKIGMPLQVDATWFYTHGKGTFGITLSELKDKNNPYNTYIHKGLPPSPIGSPSISSIKAVLYPENTGALFYLADRKGNTYYSKTYSEHLRKKKIYLR